MEYNTALTLKENAWRNWVNGDPTLEDLLDTLQELAESRLQGRLSDAYRDGYADGRQA